MGEGWDQGASCDEIYFDCFWAVGLWRDAAGRDSSYILKYSDGTGSSNGYWAVLEVIWVVIGYDPASCLEDH